MYCRYAKTSIWDHKKCHLIFYCVIYMECPLLEVPLYCTPVVRRTSYSLLSGYFFSVYNQGSQWLKFVTLGCFFTLGLNPPTHIASCNDIHMK